jgi:hypothetical protein
VVLEVETLPFSVSDFLYLEKMELLLIYLIVFFLLLLLYGRRLVYLNFILILFIALQKSSCKQEKNQIVFYSINGHSAMLFYEQQKSVLVLDSALCTDNKKMDFHLDGHLSKLSVKNLTPINLNDEFENSFLWKDKFHFQFLNRRGLIVNNEYEIRKSDSLISIDYCLITKNIDLTKLTRSYEISLLILDGSLPWYVSKKLEKKCRELELNYHNLKESSLVNKL